MEYVAGVADVGGYEGYCECGGSSADGVVYAECGYDVDDEVEDDGGVISEVIEDGGELAYYEVEWCG